MEFLEKMHVDIPDELIQQGVDVPELVKNLLADLEENPDRPCVVGDTKVWELFEELQSAVKEYYGLS